MPIIKLSTVRAIHSMAQTDANIDEAYKMGSDEAFEVEDADRSTGALYAHYMERIARRKLHDELKVRQIQGRVLIVKLV